MEMAAFTWQRNWKKAKTKHKRISVCAIWLTERGTNPHCAASPRTLCVGHNEGSECLQLTIFFSSHFSSRCTCVFCSEYSSMTEAACLSVLQKHCLKICSGKHCCDLNGATNSFESNCDSVEAKLLLENVETNDQVKTNNISD